MPYKPTFPSPYMQAISASKDGGNVFRCLINPRDSVYGYELTISSVENELKEADETTETETHTISRTVDGTTKSVDGSDVALEVGDSELPVIGSSAEDSWLAVVVPKDLLTDGRSYTWRIKLFGSKVDAGQQNIVVAEGLSGTYYNEIKGYRTKLEGDPYLQAGFDAHHKSMFTFEEAFVANIPDKHYWRMADRNAEPISWNDLTESEKNKIIVPVGRYYMSGYTSIYRELVKNNSLDFFDYGEVARKFCPLVAVVVNLDFVGRAAFYPNSGGGWHAYTYKLLGFNCYENTIITEANLSNRDKAALISPILDRSQSTQKYYECSISDFGISSSLPLRYSFMCANGSIPSNVSKGMYILYKSSDTKVYCKITSIDSLSFDGETYFDCIGLESPIPLSNESKNVSFSVVSNYVESTDFYFNTRTEPNVSITVKNLTSPDGDTVTLSSSILEATGLYTQQQSIPIESYVFNLYSSDGELIDTSGDIISSKITYTYKGLMTNRDYTLELAVTNEDGVVIKVEKEILCCYSDGDSDISTWAYFVTDKNDYTETSAYNAGTVCVAISNESTTTPYFCDVIRRDVKTDEIKIIATDVAVDGDDTIMISDYTAQSGRAYRYMVTPFNDKRTAFISAETGEVTSNLAGVMLYDLTPTADKKVFNVTKNSVYLFDTDLQFGELKLNNTKNYTETYSAYPHEAYTKNNHLVGSVEALLGTYNCGKDYVGDGIDRMDDFKKLAVNGHLKLIKDRMGNCIIGDIEDVSYSYVRENGKDMTKLSFNFTELADSKSITVYAEG